MCSFSPHIFIKNSSELTVQISNAFLSVFIRRHSNDGFKLSYKVALAEIPDFLCDLRDGVNGISKQKLRLIYSKMNKIIIRRGSHLLFKKPDKVIFWYIDLIYHIVDIYLVLIIIFNIIYHALYIFIVSYHPISLAFQLTYQLLS